MARFTGGWIKIHKSLMESDIVQNSNCFLVWMWFLLNVNYKESRILWDGKVQRTLKPGQTVYGIREIAEFWKLSNDTVHNWIKYLIKTERITNEVCSRGSLVTVLNWEEYQGSDGDEEVMRERNPNDNRTADERSPNINEEYKNNINIVAKTTCVIPRLGELWNEHSHQKQTKVKGFGEKSKLLKAARERWNEHPHDDFWIDIVKKVSAIPFCLGENDRGWIATFSFLVKPDTAQKVLDGVYNELHLLHLIHRKSKSKTESKKPNVIEFKGTYAD